MMTYMMRFLRAASWTATLTCRLLIYLKKIEMILFMIIKSRKKVPHHKRVRRVET